jgi:acetyl-CoA carboxylase biotin carboxyl carrier protein
MKPKKDKKGTGAFFEGPDVRQIEEVLRVMKENNLEEFEYSRGDVKIRLKKAGSGTMVMARPMAPEIIVASGPTEEAARPAAAGAGGEGRATEDLHIVKSPIVGTFYASPSPGAAPFVKVGSHVENGQTLCIVEAMKLMNEIESDAGGEIIRVFAENGQPVEYGQPLFGIRPSRKK